MKQPVFKAEMMNEGFKRVSMKLAEDAESLQSTKLGL